MIDNNIMETNINCGAPSGHPTKSSNFKTHSTTALPIICGTDANSVLHSLISIVKEESVGTKTLTFQKQIDQSEVKPAPEIIYDDDKIAKKPTRRETKSLTNVLASIGK
jgi:hypothetical protein